MLYNQWWLYWGKNSSDLARLANGRRLLIGWCWRNLLRNDGSLCRFQFEGSCCLLFRGTTADASPLENAPPQWLRSWNDSEAYTLPTSRSRANHYTAWFSGADNKLIGDLPNCQVTVEWPPTVQLSEIESNYNNTGNVLSEQQNLQFPT